MRFVFQWGDSNIKCNDYLVGNWSDPLKFKELCKETKVINTQIILAFTTI